MLSIGVTFDNDEDLDGTDKARKSDMENQNDNPQILEEEKNWSIFVDCSQFSLFLLSSLAVLFCVAHRTK